MSRSIGICALAALTLIAVRAMAAPPATEKITLGDDLFAAGDDVHLAQPVKGDVFVAGRDVETTASVGGDLVAVATELHLSATVANNLYAAARHLELAGSIGHAARIAAGELRIAPDARVGGGLSLAAQSIQFEGQSQGYLSAAAQSIHLDGHVGGDADIIANQLDVGPQAVIDGKLQFRGPRPPNVASTARIAGGVHFIQQPIRQRGGRHGGLFRLGSWLWLIGWMIAGAVIIGIWPGFTRSVTDATAARAAFAAVIGLAALVATPVLMALLALTVIGVPLALLLLALYCLLLSLGYLAAAATIADRIVPAAAGVDQRSEPVTARRIGVLVAMLLVLFFLRHAPYIGPIVTFLLLLVGMGGILLGVGAAYEEPIRRAPAASQPV